MTSNIIIMASEVRSKRISCRLQRAQDATGGPGVVQEETVNQLSVIQTKNSPFVQQNSAAEEGAAESNQSAQHGLRAAIGAFSSKSYLHEDQVTPNSPPPPPPVSMPKALQPLASVRPTAMLML